MRTCRYCEVKFDDKATPQPPVCTSRGGEQLCEGKARGFATMSKERISEIASKGGKSAHAAGTAHQFSTEEAKRAGHLGGNAPHVRRGPIRRSA